MGKVKNRFELLIFETAEEYLKRMARKEADRKIKIQIYKLSVEKRGVCVACEKPKPYLRWIRDYEVYCCYKCFIEDLSCEADIMVPMRNVTQMEDYITEEIWNELWDEENGVGLAK